MIDGRFSLVLAVLLCASVENSLEQSGITQDNVFTWFNKYGYNPCFNSDALCSLSLSSLIKQFQMRFRLKPTGELDESTKRHMNRPRCGNHDKAPAALSSAAAPKQFQWSRPSLTYSLRGHPPQISEAQTSAIIREAFNAWLDYVPLEITAKCSTCKADFIIEFAQGQHADSYPFDGVGGTLAHAFFPEDGRLHFDWDERWTEEFDKFATNLYSVAVHEIGHALGLEHTYDQRSIMYPFYQLLLKRSVFPQNDREAIQRLYGSKKSSTPAPTTTTRRPTTKRTRTTTRTTKRTTTRPTTTTTKRTTTRATTTKAKTTTRTTTKARRTTTSPRPVANGKPHSRCRVFLDTAFLHPDGTVHTFIAGTLWRYVHWQRKWESRGTQTRDTYPKLSSQLAAGAYHTNKRQLYFFTNTHVYYYDLDRRDQARFGGKQRLTSSLEHNIVGAIYYRNVVYVITRLAIWLFQLESTYHRMDRMNAVTLFPGFTGTAVSAFSVGDVHHFFTSDRLIYSWNERSNAWQTFGKPMETNWLACPSTGVTVTNGSRIRNSG